MNAEKMARDIACRYVECFASERYPNRPHSGICNDLTGAIAALIAQVDREARPQWQPIETAPHDGEVWVYVAARDGLQAFQCECAWHPDAGFCPDELRHATHWMPLPKPPASPESKQP